MYLTNKFAAVLSAPVIVHIKNNFFLPLLYVLNYWKVCDGHHTKKYCVHCYDSVHCWSSLWMVLVARKREFDSTYRPETPYRATNIYGKCIISYIAINEPKYKQTKRSIRFSAGQTNLSEFCWRGWARSIKIIN